MSALDDVIRRLEAGESGIDMDGRIWCALNGVKFAEAWENDHSRSVAFTCPPKRTLKVRPYGRDDLPRYTTSLDAAVSLVPEGMDWFVKHYASAGGKYGAVVTSPELARRWGDYSCDDVATPALALCIASLKARKP